MESNVSYGNTVRPPGRIALNDSYLKSVPGIVRIVLILSHIGGVISAILISNFSNKPIGNDFSVTRQAYIIITSIGGCLSGLLFLFHFCNLVHVKLINKLPWIMIVSMKKIF